VVGTYPKDEEYYLDKGLARNITEWNMNTRN